MLLHAETEADGEGIDSACWPYGHPGVDEVN